MLEAALRGDMDDGLGEDLMRGSSLSSQDSFSSAQNAEDILRSGSDKGLSPQPSTSGQKKSPELLGQASPSGAKSSGATTVEQMSKFTDQSILGSSKLRSHKSQDDAVSTDGGLSEASEHVDSQIRRQIDLAEGMDETGQADSEPSLEALLRDQGDLFSDD